VLISQLKAHIFELEQHEKDYDSLNSKFRSLQNECALLSEEKLRLEYELRQRSESQNKQILDMRGENENLQLNFNEKMSLNKKLYNDNNNLIKTLEIRNAEINDLKERLDEWMSKYNKISDEKIGFERSVLNLNDVKASQKIEISRLMEDNQKLSKMYQDADKHNKSLDNERLKLLSKNDELNFELKNVTGKLKSKEDNLNYIQRILEETKITTQKSEKNLKEYEKQIDYQRSEIGNLSATLNRERVLRAELEKSNEKYQSAINDHNKEINRLSNEVEASRAISKRITDEKIFSKNENDKLKNHIMILTENNHKVNLINYLTLLACSRNRTYC